MNYFLNACKCTTHPTTEERGYEITLNDGGSRVCNTCRGFYHMCRQHPDKIIPGTVTKKTWKNLCECNDVSNKILRLF